MLHKGLGITSLGQFVTRQEFIEGELPTQDEVDIYLEGLGLEPVKRSCWVWKKVDADAGIERWIGDARADNFVKTASDLIPIDLRMWGVLIE